MNKKQQPNDPTKIKKKICQAAKTITRLHNDCTPVEALFLNAAISLASTKCVYDAAHYLFDEEQKKNFEESIESSFLIVIAFMEGLDVCVWEENANE